MKKRLIALLMVCALLISVAAPASAKVGCVYKTTCQGLHLREKASSSGNILMSLTKGTTVVHLASSGNWWKVRTLKGYVGYVFNSYLTPTSASSNAKNLKVGKIYRVNTARVTVRASASRSGSSIGTLTKGKKVKVLAVKNGWARIQRGNKYGYIFGSYLS